MKTFQEFVLIAEAAYDASVMGSSQIRRIGDGGRVGAERRKTEPELRRTKRVGGGQTVSAARYKPRKDIGTQRKAETRVQQPETERGSARERQLAAAKEERRKAAQARAAAKKTGTAATAAKPKAKEVEKQASQLLKKKKEAPQREKQVKTVKGDYTRAEKRQLKRLGRRTLRDLVLSATGKKKESQLKHKYTGTGDEGGKD